MIIVAKLIIFITVSFMIMSWLSFFIIIAAVIFIVKEIYTDMVENKGL